MHTPLTESLVRMNRDRAESAFFLADVTETFFGFLGFADNGFLRVGVDALDSPLLELFVSRDSAVGFGCACRGNSDMVSFFGDVVSVRKFCIHNSLSTSLIRSPIHLITGTAIEFPKASYLKVSGAPFFLFQGTLVQLSGKP